MTTGEWIVVALFGAGLVCSLSLLWWLRKLIRQERHHPGAIRDIEQATPETRLNSTQNSN